MTHVAKMPTFATVMAPIVGGNVRFATLAHGQIFARRMGS
jgi:hypothetical protein